MDRYEPALHATGQHIFIYYAHQKYACQGNCVMNIVRQPPKTLNTGRVSSFMKKNKWHLAQIFDVSEGFRRLP